MAQKETITTGSLTEASTWDNNSLPQDTDDVFILHGCWLSDNQYVSYASVTIGTSPYSALQCYGNNSISTGNLTIDNYGSVTVNGSTTFSAALRLQGSRSGAAINVAGPSGSLTVTGDVINAGLEAGTTGIAVDHELIVQGALRGTCDANTLISVQGASGGTLTLSGGIEAQGIMSGVVVALGGGANVYLNGSAFLLRGENVFSGSGHIHFDGPAISAPGDPSEWYPIPSNVRLGILYRNGNRIGSYQAIGYPQPAQVVSGAYYGENGDLLGTRVDCPIDKALSTASYGVPGNPFVGEVNLDLYTLKSSVVAAASVLRDVPRWTGGPVGAYWPVTISQVQTGVAFGPNGALVGNMQSLDWTDAERRQIRQALGIAGDKTATAGGHLDAVKAQTDLLPAQPAAAGDPMTLAAAERAALADALLTRDMTHVEATAPEHSLCYVVLAMTESDVLTHPGRLTVFRSDGTTEFARKNLTTQADAAPITGVH